MLTEGTHAMVAETAPVLTRQRKWQLKMASLNRCQVCGKPTSHYKTYCDDHGLWKRKLRRRSSRSKPWKPGAKGRPPLI